MNIQVSQVLELLKSQWENIPEHYMIVMYLVATIFALLNCFMGYRLRKVWGCILGVAAGAGGGAVAGYYFLQDKVMAAVCGAGGALILGLMAWLLYKFGVFVMSAALVYGMVISMFQDASMTQHIIGAAAGIFAGTLALGYERQMVIGITSVCGGVQGIRFLMAMTGKDAGAGEWILGLVLAVIGLIAQVAPFLREREEETRERMEKSFELPQRRKTKVVKKKKVEYVTRQREADSRRGTESPLRKRRDYDWDEIDDEDEDEEEEIYEEYIPSSNREELDKTREYTVGQKQYEEERQKVQTTPYLAPGIGIDLDDLNRELSQEIKKIYEDDSQN